MWKTLFFYIQTNSDFGLDVIKFTILQCIFYNIQSFTWVTKPWREQSFCKLYWYKVRIKKCKSVKNRNKKNTLLVFIYYYNIRCGYIWRYFRSYENGRNDSACFYSCAQYESHSHLKSCITNYVNNVKIFIT